MIRKTFLGHYAIMVVLQRYSRHVQNVNNRKAANTYASPVNAVLGVYFLSGKTPYRKLS